METEVLIVGAGPVGLTCSILLSRLGVANQVIERRDGPHTLPQAHLVSSRTMEIFRAAGLDEAGLREVASPPGDLAGVQWVHTLAGPELGRIELATPERIIKMLTTTPAPMANISQHRLEPMLVEEARKRGASVDFGHEWMGMERDGADVVSDVAGPSGPDRVASRFLLGGDGAASRVRRSQAIPMTGPERIDTFLNVHLAANWRPLLASRPAILYWHMDPEEPGFFVAHDIDSTFIYMHPHDPATHSLADFDESTCRGLVSRALGSDDPFEILAIDSWVMTCQVADHYGDAPVFLVGDAAHRFPPSGGLGLNTGVADAYNLVWKLAAVRDGRAGPSLLETYEAERRGVALVNSETSFANYRKMQQVVDAIGVPAGTVGAEARALVRSLPDDRERARCVQEAIDRQAEHFDSTGLDLGHHYERGSLAPDGTPELHVDNPVTDYEPSTRPGSLLPHAWLTRGEERISTHDLVDARAPVLLTGPEGTAWREAADALGVSAFTIASRIGRGGDLVDAEGRWAAECQISAAGAILVRPDAHVGWRSVDAAADPGAVLRAALARILPGCMESQSQ